VSSTLTNNEATTADARGLRLHHSEHALNHGRSIEGVATCTLDDQRLAEYNSKR
jgi:hypothetical protein